MDSEYREDAWYNPQTGIGDANESAETRFLRNRLLTLDELSDLYYHDDLAYRVVSALPREAMKREPEVVCKNATPEQVQHVKDRLTAMDFYSKVTDAAVFGRLYGDAGLWMATAANQGEKFTRGEHVRFLKQLDRRVLIVGGYYTNPDEENLGSPASFLVVPVGMTMGYRNLGTVVHETRIPQFHGTRLDPVSKAWNMGWNHSVLQRIHATIRDMGETWAGISILLRELSIKVLRVKGLTAAQATRPDLVRFRLRMARQNLSTLHMLAIDSDSEDFSRVEAGTLTGAASILEQVLLRVAAAAEMPVTRLYGRSPSGLNATGDEETRQWYDTVATYQQKELLPPMLALLEGVTGSMYPGIEGWGFKFPSLWQPTETEKNANAKGVADIDAVYISNGVFSAEQIAVLRGGPNGSMTPEYTAVDVSVQAALARMPSPRGEDGPSGGLDPSGDGTPPTPVPPVPPPVSGV